MSRVKKVRKRQTYWVRDSECIERSCFSPGMKLVRNSPSHACCLINANHGCPEEPREQSAAVKRTHHNAGWRNVS